MHADHDRPLRICLLSYRSDPHCGGQGVYVQNLSRALSNLGHQVEVVSGPPPPILAAGIPLFRLPGLDLYNPQDLFRTPSFNELCDPVNLLEWLGVSSMGFPEPMTFGIRASKFLKSRRTRYDIVHDNPRLSYGIRAISRWLPTVVTIHHPITIDRDLAVKAAPSFWKKLQQMRWYSFIGMQKRVARHFKHIITVSKTARDDIGRDFKIPGQRFRIVPNGVDTDLFHPLAGVEREKNRVIVTTSADTPLKGLGYLLRAVAQTASTCDLKLVIVGALKKDGDMVKLIRQLGIGDRIVFTGRIDHDEFIQHYARASVAVVPSVYEGFGLPAIEAMACGLPVIGTTGGALPEVIADAGILVPPADAEALATALAAFFADPQQAIKMGQAGLQRVRRHFTWSKAAEMTAAVYREAIRDYR